MYRIVKEIAFSYGHRLTKHPGKCAHLHGHNAIAEIHCESPSLDQNEMVLDFQRIKDSIKTWIDEKLDHRMILNKKDPVVRFLKESREEFFEIDGDPTAEVIARIIFEEASKRGLPVVRVKLWETPTSSAVYEE